MLAVRRLLRTTARPTVAAAPCFAGAQRRLMASSSSSDGAGSQSQIPVKETTGRLASTYMKFLPIENKDLRRMMGQGLALGTYGMVAASLLGTAGVDISPLLAGVGGAGVTLGFALKDVAANAIAGFTLVIEGPFTAGDVVRVGPEKTRGRVVIVGHRYVHLDILDDANQVVSRIMIPTAAVHAHPIVIEPAATPSAAKKKPKNDKP